LRRKLLKISFTSGFIAGFRVITSRGRFITRRTTPAESIFILNNEKKSLLTTSLFHSLPIFIDESSSDKQQASKLFFST